MLTGHFIDEQKYVSSGYDKSPALFSTADNKQWKFVHFLDEGVSKPKPSKIGKDAFGGKTVFFDSPLENDVEISEMTTKHSNYINV